MGKEYKLFSPTIMFNDFISAAWCCNIVTKDGKLPIHPELKANGVYAISIEPKKEDSSGVDWYAFGLPFRKDWLAYDLTMFRNPQVVFEVVGESPVTMNVELASMGDERFRRSVECENTDSFGEIRVDIGECPFLNNLKLLLWTGSVTSGRYVMRNIRVVEK